MSKHIVFHYDFEQSIQLEASMDPGNPAIVWDQYSATDLPGLIVSYYLHTNLYTIGGSIITSSPICERLEIRPHLGYN